MHKIAVLFILVFFMADVYGQQINTSYTYRDMHAHRYVRYLYENDFFRATDKFYTQGINLEYAAPGLKKLPTSRVLINPKNYTSQYKIALQHNGYTPQSIQDPNLRRGDRPYAAAFMLQFANTATSYQHHLRISTMLSVGVLGRIAGGEWMQKTIHRNLDNVMPQGWHYQIANDAVINYRLQLEKQLLSIENILLLNATTSIDAGTLLNKFSVGGNILLGLFNMPYKNADGILIHTIRLYAHPQLHVVGYDATMQGGVLAKSPYTLSPNQIDRFVFDNRYGIAVQLGRVYLEYYYQNISREFKTGKAHSWGGIVVGVGF